MIYTDELFGLENYAAFKVALQGTGISMVEDKSFPTNTKDLSPVLRSHQGQEPRRLRRLHLSGRHRAGQSAEQGDRLQPEVLLPERRHRVPALPATLTPAGVEGVLGMGSWNGKTQQDGAGLLRRAREEARRRSPTAGPAAPAGPAWRSCTSAVGQGGPGPQGDPRLHRQHRPRHDSRQDQVPAAARTSARPARSANGRSGEFEVVWPKAVATGSLIAEQAWVWK